MKKYIIVWVSIFLILISNAISVFAVSENLIKVEAIIAGKQDKLVFATISKIGSNVAGISVIEEIGEVEAASDESDEDDIDIPSIVGMEIDISGLDSYVYFGNDGHTPKIGDNILVSLAFDGNVYHIKNGAFLVNEASYTSFKFLLPESVDDKDNLMELTALYKFVSSNGKNADYTVKNSSVYTHDINNNEIRTTEPEGIIFIDESGEKTKETSEAIVDTESMHTSSSSVFGKYSWMAAGVIIVIGMIAGAFVVKMILKIEKRSEMK